MPSCFAPSAEAQEAFSPFAPVVGRYFMVADPLADELVDVLNRLPAGRGRKMLDTVLASGIEAVRRPPIALTEFFEHVNTPPFGRITSNSTEAVRCC